VVIEMAGTFPHNLKLLHEGEEFLRAKSVSIIESNARLLLHAVIVEQAMDLLDVFRQFPTDDEDLKVIQMLGLRLFNALASSIKLLLGGYAQTSALVMRDILETVFLLDFFRTNRPSITQWRLADKKARLRDFKPVKIREVLDQRDGFTSKKRGDLYALFSELAGHPSMPSVVMLRPKGMDARNGPFLDPTALEVVLSELGKLAVQVGELIGAYMPAGWEKGAITRQAFELTKARWMAEFFGNVSKS
jgi:hypothetical protein